ALAPRPAIIAGAAIAFVTAVVVRRYLQSFVRFARFVDALARGDAPDTPRFTLSPAADELARGVVSLDAMWTRQRGAMESLSASAQAIIDGLPDPLIGVDGQRRVVRVNRAAADVLGPVAIDRDLAATLRQPALLAAVDAARTGLPVDGAVEFELPGPPERSVAAHVARLARPTADGSLVLVVLHDITALRRAERMRADFVANASHELRTPLASLTGFIETLQGPARGDADAHERFLAIMAEQAGRMRRLVEDLLSLSRIEQREHQPPTGRVEIGPLLRGLATALEMRATGRGVALAVEVADDLPAIPGDRDELAMAIQNLIDNAVKYARAGTTVRIEARPAAGGTVAVSVRDEGEGIAPEHLSRLTERFYRVDSARSREMGGTGLGLAIVKHIVSRHRGALTVASEPGEGSVFTITLPTSPSTGRAASVTEP
ncbi:MAG: PAS domain-containing protein, partial [Rhodospirillales bacterium]|nr:PAS domain-containing protein [Rhodospirillales bacterium]